jgi:hypothetical protein
MAARINATKKAPAKKTPSAAVHSGGGGIEVLRLTSASSEPVDTVPLFEIDGVEYSVPRKPRANIALKYLATLEARGPEIASVYLMRAVLGDEGYAALSNCDSLTEAHLEWLIETLHGLVMGTTEAPKA